MESMEGSLFWRRFLPENLFDGLLARGDIPPQGTGREGVQPIREGSLFGSYWAFPASFSHFIRTGNHFHSVAQYRPQRAADCETPIKTLLRRKHGFTPISAGHKTRYLVFCDQMRIFVSVIEGGRIWHSAYHVKKAPYLRPAHLTY